MKTQVTNELLVAIVRGSQEFAELAIEDKIRWFELENKQLREQATGFTGSISAIKVSEKGAVSVYGLGRFPVSLYRKQWRVLLDPVNVKRIEQFFAANEAKLNKLEEEYQANKKKK